MGYRRIKIDNPVISGSNYDATKKFLAKKGYGAKRNYRGAKIVDTTEYYYDSYTIKLANGVRTTIPAGHFFAYTCTYPDYKANKVTVTKSGKGGSQFYDDSIDDVLGGEKRELGV